MLQTITSALLLSAIAINANVIVEDVSPYLAGGELVKRIQDFPFISALIPTNGTNIKCAGSIITPSWVLTTATCCKSLGSDFNVFTGSVDLENGGKLSKVKNSIMHPFFDKNEDTTQYLPNDICLVQLENPLTFNKRTEAVSLPPADYSSPILDANVTVLGWGQQSTNYPGTSNQLRFFTEFTVYPDICVNAELPGDRVSFVGKICIENGGNGKSGCNGDEGAPLVYNSSIQLGTFSYYHNIYCETSKYSGYTKLSHYVPWIMAILGDDAQQLKIASYAELPCRFTCLFCCDY